ncbi:MAG: DUF4295 domain-containing protein, partial [Paramuribaculum sp.]|nr:DUF4295 domain-containing protein [Paramuribaculum sp.]
GEGRTYSKVIKVVKSPKTGAYTFQEQMPMTLSRTSSNKSTSRLLMTLAT